MKNNSNCKHSKGICSHKLKELFEDISGLENYETNTTREGLHSKQETDSVA